MENKGSHDRDLNRDVEEEEHALYQVAIREIATRGAGKASERATTRFHLVSETRTSHVRGKQTRLSGIGITYLAD